MLQQLITDNIDLWTSAETKRSTTGRGSNSKIELTGIKKLRELILELAVRGLLTPQDPNDEPASVLLAKIAAEKAQLITDGKIKKQKPLSAITEDEKPFKLPAGWVWQTLGAVCKLENGDRSKNYPNKSVLVEKGIPFINAGHLQNGLVDVNQMTFIPRERFDLLRSGKIREGDILYCLRGSLGKSALVQGIHEGAIASSLVIIRLYSHLNERFFINYFDCPLSTKMVKNYDNGTAQPNLSATDLAKFLIPIPPLAEQHRIVAKVDELMALCDQLEQQQLEHSDTHHTLVTTLLDSLCHAADNAQFQTIWSQLAANFDTLFTTEASIDQLKQTILQLAVMGKLVPQDPNDEPASVLLEKITAEKEALIKAGKIKKQKPLPEISDDEKMFALPDGWEWARLTDCYDVRDGTHDTPKYTSEGYPLITSKNLSSGKLDFSDIKFISETDHRKIIERSKVDAGDILFAMIGSIGNSVIVDTEREFSIKNVALFKYYLKSLANPAFLLRFLLFAETVFKEQASGAVQSFVSLGKIRNFPIALPPLAEQHRIVAKVDELMALCDQLKDRLSQAQTTQQQLAHAIIEQAVN